MGLRLLLWAALALGLPAGGEAFQPVPYPTIRNKTFIRHCVDAHNQFRAGVSPPAANMLYMTWDPALAKTAKAWAKKCIFDHNIYLRSPGKVHPEFTPVGENIWTGSLPLFSEEAAICDWYNEVKDYDFESRVCAKMCGHYTQVVWATSYKVGCAVQFCRSVSGFPHLSNGAHFVCNYGKAGNYPVHPYKRGRACSECKGDTCVQNLCENPERDQLKSYSHWYPDWNVPKHGTKSPPKIHPPAPDPVFPRPTRQMTPQKPRHTSTPAPKISVSSRSAYDSPSEVQ
ncbi:glioma pathogenesis-related protein 1-like [Tiliqua scincoides]|uniref:glioma pathogenesis-related protein 1-like n=1 Tax=Tiliqua scincoides TaxID=71010 RepID=UPI0034619BB2